MSGMSTKKDPGKFTLHFNLNDPQQKMAVDILNQQGRQKAAFLAKALIFYMEYHAASPKNLLLKDQADLEQAIIAVLTKNPGILSAKAQPIESPFPYDILDSEQTSQVTPAIDQDKPTGMPGFDAIHKTMAAFRRK